MIYDLHVDSIIQQRLFGYDVGKLHPAAMRGQPLFWHADIPRMQEAGYSGACLGIHFFPWESERGWMEMRRQIDYLDSTVANREDVIRVREPGDWQKGAADGPLALAPGVEGAHMLDGQVGRVESLADRHVAYLTLTHFSKNAAATPSMGRGANESDGLTDFGRDLVAALQEHDILVDLAHVNTPGVLDTCTVATRPILCTHTGVKGLHDSPRNITDDEIDAIAETGGLVGIIFAPIFLTGRLKADSRCVADHAAYVAERVGVDHVGIGSDYDGWIPSIPSDQRDCRDIDKVAEALEARGFDEAEVDQIMGGNALEMLSGERG